METYKSPLTIYVVWHPSFKEGMRYAENIYSTFCRDVNKPLSRGLGIPVFFRFHNINKKSYPLGINFKESKRNAIVVLIDEEMFNDFEWCKYVRTLNSKVNKSCRIYPISFSRYSYSLDEYGLSKSQFISVHDIINKDTEREFKDRWKIIRSRLLHDFSRLMLNIKSVYEAGKSSIPPPVKLFISHAKNDGLKLASYFRDYIESNTKLNTFFDANDIADGYDFEQQIKKNISDNVALVVFHSDEYSDREWCRIEVITAKKYKAPVIVVHNIKKGEKRSFPYMGNVPTIKWKKNIVDIVDLALIQVLYNLFAKEKLKRDLIMYNASLKYSCIEISSPPELFNYIEIANRKINSIKPILVIYPDPPLGKEELNLLNELDNKVEFITPTLLPNINIK